MLDAKIRRIVTLKPLSDINDVYQFKVDLSDLVFISTN